MWLVNEERLLSLEKLNLKRKTRKRKIKYKETRRKTKILGAKKHLLNWSDGIFLRNPKELTKTLHIPEYQEKGNYQREGKKMKVGAGFAEGVPWGHSQRRLFKRRRLTNRSPMHCGVNRIAPGNVPEPLQRFTC